MTTDFKLSKRNFTHFKPSVRALLPKMPTLLAAVVAYGPVALALLLCWLGGDRASWRWPFQKERLVGQFGFFAVLGWLACMLPVYHSTKWVCEA